MSNSDWCYKNEQYLNIDSNIIFNQAYFKNVSTDIWILMEQHILDTNAGKQLS